MSKSRCRQRAADSARLPVVSEEFGATTDPDRLIFQLDLERFCRIRVYAEAEQRQYVTS